MSKTLLPVGLIALLLSALSLSAQVRDDPRQSPDKPAVPGRKTVAPDGGLAPGVKAPDDKKAASRNKRCHVYLGVCTMPVEDMSNRTRRKMKLDNTDGVIVVEVMQDSPADEAGIKHGDVITHVNGKVVDDEDELSKDLHELGPHKPVKLTVIREGKKQEITAELEEAPAGEGDHGVGMDEEHARLMHENAMRIERLERKISRLERRLKDMEQTRSTKNAQ